MCVQVLSRRKQCHFLSAHICSAISDWIGIRQYPEKTIAMPHFGVRNVEWNWGIAHKTDEVWNDLLQRWNSACTGANR
jgi:hypothetical protein